MYFYVVRNFEGIGWRYLSIYEKKPCWRNHPPRSYDFEEARKLADKYDCEVVEV